MNQTIKNNSTGNSWHIRGARIIDPTTGRDEEADLYIIDGRVAASCPSNHSPLPVIDARGLILAPGFVDLHVHFRQPGNEAAETIASGLQAAARGGFTTVVTMPNTTPATDTPDLVAWIKAERNRCGNTVQILPTGCISVGRKGLDLADMQGMARAGAIAFTDDGSTIADPVIMERAMRVAATLRLPIMDHALDPAIGAGGVIREGPVSHRMGLPGIPVEAEVDIVRRDAGLAALTGCSIHIQHLSASASVDLIRHARKQGLPVSAEATPHHLTLTDADIPGDDANFKMSPPLGSNEDREALVEGIVDGTIGAFATDHAPHLQALKAKGFMEAPFGVVGLETAVGVTYTALVQSGRLSLIEWVRRWTTGPSAILGLPLPSLATGTPANLVLLDLDTPWTVSSSHFLSRSRNTPFEGRQLKGMSAITFCGGIPTWIGSDKLVN